MMWRLKSSDQGLARPLVLLSLASAFPVLLAFDSPRFQQQVKSALDDVVETARKRFGQNVAMQLSWQSPHASLAMAAGSVEGRSTTLEDTFLFGSGTKAVTAAATLHLIDKGIVRGDDKVVDFVNPLLAASGDSLEGMFGPGIRNATLLDLLHMRAGIPDFEEARPPDVFDATVLRRGGEVWPPAASLEYSSKLAHGKLLCEPGNCTCYSTASYELVGLVVASVLKVAYDHVDPGDCLGLPGLHFPDNAGRLWDVLTVPGLCLSASWPQARIWAQNPSILSGTGGNMVATSRAVAEFYHRLFTGSLLSDEGLQEMLSFSDVSVGYGEGSLTYGAGLMELSASYDDDDDDDDPTYYYGSPGETYGFISYQGWWPRFNASFSIVVNTDYTGADYAGAAQCILFQLALHEFGNQSTDLKCTAAYEETNLVARGTKSFIPSAHSYWDASIAISAVFAASLALGVWLGRRFPCSCKAMPSAGADAYRCFSDQ